ncbi:MAG: AMP-binding protein, partial [Gemmatimonadetes bacterium]|nr:AMP-binding protein [Gemmatimonadota bacterium]
MNLASAKVVKLVEEGFEDPEGFWEQAALELPWFRMWDRVYEPHEPSFRWFVGAETNIAHNALDHHVAQGHGQRDALVYFNERAERVTFTYAQMLDEVNRVAAALRALGIEKGDRVTLSMPTCPEAVMLMLACVRIGAIHSVIFAGFGAQALADRISASGSRVVFTADITYRRGKEIPLKPLVDDALRSVGGLVENVVVLQRASAPISLFPDRDIPWDAFLAGSEGHSGDWVAMEANEPAFILATSGTTAKPKLAVHTHGGYQVHVASMVRWCFGLEPTDVWWATSDIGWIVGHSYMVYGPMLIGCTTVVFEGALEYPEPEANWRTAV